LASGLFHLIIAFTNTTDYAVNFEFVKHVLSMDTLFPVSTITYRSIHSEITHHFFYVTLISVEWAIAFFLIKSSVWVAKTINKPIEIFEKIKPSIYIGLTLTIILWMICFMTIGGEWFGMWQSNQWNATDTAQRLTMIHLLIAIIAQNCR
jgi:predicted small integral membrane protein